MQHFVSQHLKDIERQCMKIAILSRALRLSEYDSEEWRRAEKALDEAHEKLQQMFIDAHNLMDSRG